MWRPSIHGPPFRYPPGFGYRRWSSGLFLPRTFIAPPFFYDNFMPLGLAQPPFGFRWIRYGPDLLLVDVTTGRIADVVYGVFW